MGTEREGAAAQAADDSTASQHRFGEYLVEKRIGSGGVGAVYLARRDSDGLAVALKLLNPVANVSEEAVKRFRREAQCMLALDHLNIVKAFDIGFENGRHFICMEYVPGGSLGALIKREGRVDPRTALTIMKQVASALDYGWKHNVVHRDLKPGNILVGPDGSAKLADLGLAVLANREDMRLTAPGTVMGTPDYMSPEQARAERDLDARSDIYSLGCTMYHAVCGRVPFEGEGVVAVLRKHLSEPPVPPRQLAPGLSAGGEAILLKCMAKEPADRFQSWPELIRALDRELARPTGPAKRPAARRDAPVAAPPRDAVSDAVAALTAQSHVAPPAAGQGTVPPRAARPPDVPDVPARGPRPSTPRRPDSGKRAPARDEKPTHATIAVSRRRRVGLPLMALGVLVSLVVLALVTAVFYILFTTPR